MQMILKSLGDSSPPVVLAALDAVSDSGDSSLIEYVRPLERHADPKVRQAAIETIDYLK